MATHPAIDGRGSELVSRLLYVSATILIAVIVWRVGSEIMSPNKTRSIERPASVNTEPTASEAELDAPLVSQSSDFGMLLSADKAVCSSKGPVLNNENGELTLVNWNSPDAYCGWLLEISDPRDGFFQASIRYRCKVPARMELSTGDRRLAVWNLAASDVVTHEVKFIRITKSAKFPITLRALTPVESLRVFEIQLTARK